MIRPIHVRMARAALGWTVRDLEVKSNVGRNTISRYEAGNDILAGSLERLEKALLEEGLIFFEDDSTHGTGVGLKRRKRLKA
jgi:transcriptional regulator with XRE-family HTH domain